MTFFYALNLDNPHQGATKQCVQGKKAHSPRLQFPLIYTSPHKSFKLTSLNRTYIQSIPYYAMMPTTSVLSISELNRLTRQTLEQAFPLLWVTGEISNLTRAASGHVYFTLKDSNAQARCVMFRTRAQIVPWRLENGQQVEARTLVSFYEPRGDFQLNIENLRRAGLGGLFEEFVRLKNRLELAGLFAPERKQALPQLPRRIGIISSPKAAALQDVLTTLNRRSPHVPVVLYPTPVQGDEAAQNIANAIVLANQRQECDLLLLVRGGGSIEDLWAFNESTVAYAIAESALPIISGVGHETDTTIADFVADLRAPTPTAAAELATQHWHAMHQRLTNLQQKIARIMQHRLTNDQQRLDNIALRLTHPRHTLRQQQERITHLIAHLKTSFTHYLQHQQHHINQVAIQLDHLLPKTDNHRSLLTFLAQRLKNTNKHFYEQKHQSLLQFASSLKHLNPQNTLARGFAIVRDEKGLVISKIEETKARRPIAIEFSNGQITATVLEIQPIDIKN